MAPSSLLRLSETGLQLWAQRLPTSNQVLLKRMDVVKASMAGSEINCLTQRASTPYGKQKSSSNNGDVTTILKDHTVHWLSSTSTQNHHTDGPMANQALKIVLDQSDGAGHNLLCGLPRLLVMRPSLHHRASSSCFLKLRY